MRGQSPHFLLIIIKISFVPAFRSLGHFVSKILDNLFFSR